MSSMRSLDDVAAGMQTGQASPTASDSSAGSGTPGTLSRANSFSHYTHEPIQTESVHLDHHPRRASFSGVVGDVTRASLEGFLTNLHPMLSGLVEPFKKAGIENVATLLSLESAELCGLVDSLEEGVSPLLKMRACFHAWSGACLTCRGSGQEPGRPHTGRLDLRGRSTIYVLYHQSFSMIHSVQTSHYTCN
jgi:hypothetical protein